MLETPDIGGTVQNVIVDFPELFVLMFGTQAEHMFHDAKHRADAVCGHDMTGNEMFSVHCLRARRRYEVATLPDMSHAHRAFRQVNAIPKRPLQRHVLSMP